MKYKTRKALDGYFTELYDILYMGNFRAHTSGWEGDFMEKYERLPPMTRRVITAETEQEFDEKMEEKALKIYRAFKEV